MWESSRVSQVSHRSSFYNVAPYKKRGKSASLPINFAQLDEEKKKESTTYYQLYQLPPATALSAICYQIPWHEGGMVNKDTQFLSELTQLLNVTFDLSDIEDHQVLEYSKVSNWKFFGPRNPTFSSKIVRFFI